MSSTDTTTLPPSHLVASDPNRAAHVPGRAPADGADGNGVWQVPPLEPDDAVVAGVASGLARELGIDAIYVRVAFVVLTVAGGWGVILYGVAWYLQSRHGADPSTYQPRPKGGSVRMRHVGFAMVSFGLVVLTAGSGTAFQPALVWPIALVGAAFAVGLDRGQIDTKQLAEIHTSRQVQLRMAIGMALLLAGITAALVLNFTFWQALRSVVVAGLVLAGVAILLAPVLVRMGNELLDERRRRIRSEERADMAAHLHDSVLQTLTLIQKRSDDVGVVNLARRQERELRSWLYGEHDASVAPGVRARIEAIMAEVEDRYEVPIEVVIVGDTAAGPEVEPLLGACREAATNAARHSGAPRIDVFAEIRPERVEVFVRDLGRGFDPDAVGPDRAGIRDSIRARMQRHGGTAEIHSRLGEGTEVELALPLSTSSDEEAPDA